MFDKHLKNCPVGVEKHAKAGLIIDNKKQPSNRGIKRNIYLVSSTATTTNSSKKKQKAHDQHLSSTTNSSRCDIPIIKKEPTDKPHTNHIGNDKKTISEFNVCCSRLLTDMSTDHKLKDSAIGIFKQAKQIFFENLSKYFTVNVLPGLNSQTQADVVRDLESMREHLQTIENEYNTQRFLQRESSVMAILGKFSSCYQLNNSYKAMKDHCEAINSRDKLLNYVDGSQWKSIVEKNPGRNLLPFFLNIKDTSSCTYINVVFPVLPPIPGSSLLLAKLEEDDESGENLESFFLTAVEAFRRLEEKGVAINTGTTKSPVIVFPVLTQILTENERLNDILGIVNQHCRTCFEGEEIRIKQTRENPDKFRCKESQDSHLEMYNPLTSGLWKDCIFNHLRSYKCYDNKVFDISDDFLIGCCSSIICPVLLNLIKFQGLELYKLNMLRRKLMPTIEGKNVRTIDITMSHLMKENIPFTSDEMIEFIEHLPLLLDHIVNDKSSNDWRILMLLVKILQLLLNTEHDGASLEKLNKCIQDLLKLYLNHIKPSLSIELHSLVHIVSSIKVVGPIANIHLYKSKTQNSGVENGVKRWFENGVGSENVMTLIPMKVTPANGSATASEVQAESSGASHIRLVGEKRKFNFVNRNMFGEYFAHMGLELNNTFEVYKLEYCAKVYEVGYAVYKDNNIYQIKNIFTDNKKILLWCEKKDFTYDSSNQCFMESNKRSTNLTVFTFFDIKTIEYEPSVILDLPSGKCGIREFRNMTHY
jgi:hypothetical protein